MKVGYLVACTVCTTIGVSPLALSAPPSGEAHVTHYRSYFEYASGSSCDTSYRDCATFSVQQYDDANGVPQGNVTVWAISSDGYRYISCSGPNYANVLSTKKGVSSINATINPSDPSCNGFGFTETIALSLSGVPNGFRTSDSGTGTMEIGQAVYSYKFQRERYGQNFTGTLGYFAVNFSGSGEVGSERIVSKTRVK